MDIINVALAAMTVVTMGKLSLKTFFNFCLQIFVFEILFYKMEKNVAISIIYR